MSEVNASQASSLTGFLLPERVRADHSMVAGGVFDSGFLAPGRKGLGSGISILLRILANLWKHELHDFLFPFLG